jgi:hypothetical protein
MLHMDTLILNQLFSAFVELYSFRNMEQGIIWTLSSTPNIKHIRRVEIRDDIGSL